MKMFFATAFFIFTMNYVHASDEVLVTFHRLPGKEMGHAIVLAVKINSSIQARFVLDTGIGISLISESFCTKISCKISGQFSAKRMSGQKIILPLSSLSSAQLGPLERKSLEVGVLDMGGYPAEFNDIADFLSLNFFKT